MGNVFKPFGCTKSKLRIPRVFPNQFEFGRWKQGIKLFVKHLTTECQQRVQACCAPTHSSLLEAACHQMFASAFNRAGANWQTGSLIFVISQLCGVAFQIADCLIADLCRRAGQAQLVQSATNLFPTALFEFVQFRLHPAF